MAATYQKEKKLSLGFFYRHSFTIGVCAFIASLIFSCNFTLQFADDFPAGIEWYKYITSEAVWGRFSLFLAGFALMGGQIICFVMYKKARKNWVFGLYCGLTFLSICATFGSFAVGLENKRIESGQSDVGLQSLIDQKNILKDAIKLQDEDTKDSRKRSRISAGVDKIRPARQKNVEELGKINREILAYSKSGSIEGGSDAITKMFARTATVIQTLSFGHMSDKTRDTLAMLFECFSFIMVAVFLDLVAAFCAAISVRVDEEDFRQVVNDEAMEQQQDSDFAYIRKQNELTHEERMKNITARRTNDSHEYKAAASTTPPAPEKTISPQVDTPPVHSYNSAYHPPSKTKPSSFVSAMNQAKKGGLNMATIKLPEIPRIRPVKEIKIPKSAPVNKTPAPNPKPKQEKTENPASKKKASPDKAKSKKEFKFDKNTIHLYVENAWRVAGLDRASKHGAWRGRDKIGQYTGIKKSVRDKIHLWLRDHGLIKIKTIRLNSTKNQMWTIPNFPKDEMLKKLKSLDI